MREIRFRELKHLEDGNCTYFATDSHTRHQQTIREVAFEPVIEWCLDQFGTPPRNGDDRPYFDYGVAGRFAVPGQWRHSHRFVVVSDKMMAMAFKLRWC